LTYNWNFGDGSTGSGTSPTHVYANPGSFNATLTVTGTIAASFPGALEAERLAEHTPTA
jgi:hypothetical protein